jgi:BirA family biotin operon repressor/biotin-[acetyl-CoA-carboxylase] ligase
VTLLAEGGARFVHFGEIDSTNAEAQRQASNGEIGPLWIIADRQAKGRGRRGRQWVSEEGNLFATLLLTLAITPATATQLSFVAALAVLETAELLLPVEMRPRLLLKWPNDVLLDDRKLAGILVESVATPEKDRTTLAIGCGVNIAHAPAGTPYRVTCLADYAPEATRDAAFTLLAGTMSKQLAAWSDGGGFDVIRQCWLARAAGLGGPATVETGSGSIAGIFESLAVDGALILRCSNGEQRPIYGGEVAFSGTASTNGARK